MLLETDLDHHISHCDPGRNHEAGYRPNMRLPGDYLDHPSSHEELTESLPNVVCIPSLITPVLGSSRVCCGDGPRGSKKQVRDNAMIASHGSFGAALIRTHVATSAHTASPPPQS